MNFKRLRAEVKRLLHYVQLADSKGEEYNPRNIIHREVETKRKAIVFGKALLKNDIGYHPSQPENIRLVDIYRRIQQGRQQLTDIILADGIFAGQRVQCVHPVTGAFVRYRTVEEN